MDDKQYGIIREQGEFFDVTPLNDKDNKTVNEQDKQQKEDK